MSTPEPTLTETADLTRMLLRGHTDSSGKPIIGHVARVVDAVTASQWASPTTIRAAWLHDVVEDTGLTLGDLGSMGYSREVVQAVGLLTHDSCAETYEHYMRRIRASACLPAVVVKYFDLCDNTDPVRYRDLPVDRAAFLRARYEGQVEQMHAVLLALTEGQPVVG